MNKYSHDVPVRVVKKKKAHGGHHGGAWKVAYADFVTAMMALFIVLWILGQSRQVKQYVANYFKDPGAFFENTRGGGMFQGASVLQNQQLADEYLKREREKLDKMAQKIMSELEEQPGVQNLRDQVLMVTDKEGLRIELLESSNASFFDVGTARLRPEAVGVLATIAKEIGKLRNQVILEGHTDSRPYSRIDGYTNFELSSDRANSARRLLVTNGLRENQIVEVRGYADTKLRDAEKPYDDSNRRISILIKFEGQPSDE